MHGVFSLVFWFLTGLEVPAVCVWVVALTVNHPAKPPHHKYIPIDSNHRTTHTLKHVQTSTWMMTSKQSSVTMGLGW